ncbi:MAG: hypothetical protein WBW34_01850 [Nitrososphaeraceae archaeon]|jgi:hypothetical protein
MKGIQVQELLTFTATPIHGVGKGVLMVPGGESEILIYSLYLVTTKSNKS